MHNFHFLWLPYTEAELGRTEHFYCYYSNNGSPLKERYQLKTTNAYKFDLALKMKNAVDMNIRNIRFVSCAVTSNQARREKVLKNYGCRRGNQETVRGLF